MYRFVSTSAYSYSFFPKQQITDDNRHLNDFFHIYQLFQEKTMNENCENSSIAVTDY